MLPFWLASRSAIPHPQTPGAAFPASAGQRSTQSAVPSPSLSFSLAPQSEILEKLENRNYLSFGHTSYFITWANVIVHSPTLDGGGNELLSNIEVKLQRLWYKLYLSIESLIKLRGCSSSSSLNQFVLNLYYSIEIEYNDLVRIRPTAATEAQLFKPLLIETSKISELYSSFTDQVHKFLNDGKAFNLALGGE